MSVYLAEPSGDADHGLGYLGRQRQAAPVPRARRLRWAPRLFLVLLGRRFASGSAPQHRSHSAMSAAARQSRERPRRRRRSAGPAVGVEPVHARDQLVLVPRQVPRDDACSPVRDRDILGREALAQRVVDREQVVRRRPSELDERMRARRVDCCPDAGRSPAARGGIQSPGDPVAVERVHPRACGATWRRSAATGLLLRSPRGSGAYDRVIARVPTASGPSPYSWGRHVRHLCGSAGDRAVPAPAGSPSSSAFCAGAAGVRDPRGDLRGPFRRRLRRAGRLAVADARNQPRLRPGVVHQVDDVDRRRRADEVVL